MHICVLDIPKKAARGRFQRVKVDYYRAFIMIVPGALEISFVETDYINSYARSPRQIVFVRGTPHGCPSSARNKCPMLNGNNEWEIFNRCILD